MAANSEAQSTSIPKNIVGIGASAGGLSALEQFFDNMPADTGMTFVIIQHLSPDFKSLMDDLLARHTSMPIHRVTNGIELQANSIYLIPPKTNMTVSQEKLYLTEKIPHPSTELPIDIFLNSLAEDAKERAVGIILSGTGSDGSKGIIQIHKNGGLVIAQSPESAQFDGMPRSAITTGVCDFILGPDRIPRILAEYAISPLIVRTKMNHELEVYEDEGEFAGIFALLRRSYNLDFSKYKGSTVGRRIRRRMEFRQIPEVPDYVAIVSGDQTELELLYKDLLIGVTEFFRDKQAFQFLELEIIPKIFHNLRPDEDLRVWSAGCATGEEPYSLAILLAEKAKELDYAGKITVFATDVHKSSLEYAAQGVYDRSRLTNVSPERLDKFFRKEGTDLYRVTSELRKLVVFAPHNLLNDPPFTRLDLVCCRNLLIYFQGDVQERVISLFHFALKKEAMLFLGASEGLGSFVGEFEVIANQHKLFRKIRDLKLALNLDSNRLERHNTGIPVAVFPSSNNRNVNMDRQVLADYDTLLRRHMPPGVLIDENRQIIHYFGNVAEYLKMPEGRAENNILALAGDNLHIALSTSLQKTDKTKQDVVTRNVRVRHRNEELLIDLTVSPLTDDKNHTTHYHVYFERVRAVDHISPKEIAEDEDSTDFEAQNHFRQHIEDLEMELQSTKESLQTTVEELQTSNEELQATNEELLASNEELQSTNEELHSVNEELYSVNSEFERKNIELKQLNNDHENLLSSIDIGTVFLDRSLRIRKYNAAIASFFKLMPQDIGRPIDHIAYHLSHQELMLADIARVLQTGEPITAEEENRDKSWLLRKIMPFRTENGAIEGVVVTFTDITTIKAAELNVRRVNEELEEKVLERTAELNQEIQERRRAEADLVLARDHYLSILDEAPALIWRANTEAQCDWFNRTWLAFTGRTMEEEYGNGWAKGVHPEDLDRCVEIWLSSFRERKAFEMEYRLKRYDGEYRWILDVGRPSNQTDGSFAGYIGYCFDVTERRQAAKALKDSEANLRARLEAIASPDIDISTEDLVRIFDASAVQEMMDAFYAITSMGIGIIDLNGNVIVSTGWQRVCTDFYRRHPESLKNCVESDLALTRGVEQGKIKLYRCKNGMWDMVTPLIADDKHFANIFLGQFFFDNEVPDFDALEEQARKFDFDIDSYRKALTEIPVWSRTRVHSTMTFYARFASLIARQCVSSVKFAKSLELQRKTEEKLIQSQKVESIGRLAGGVAHDFNNMLGVILGHTELLLEQIEPESSVREDLLEIDKAAKRSADITRQLLAFARKQTIAPKLLDLNEALQPVLNMIKRLIGEDIALHYKPGADLWMVKIDPSQIDQIITNLATNARDAIPGVGSIAVTTQNKVISASESENIPDSAPGEYVVLSFIDDGEGIDSGKIPHIFDPFFTTKEVGKGSGLGLATVYGIVRQNGGFVQVESEPGYGAAFHIYLPRTNETAVSLETNDYSNLNGTETVLIVEDEKSNLSILQKYLSRLGYRVLAAGHPKEAIELVRTEKNIDLLLSDVVMPDINGKELSEALCAEIAGLRCLFMSGYTSEIIEQRGVIGDEVNFIQKPFELKHLAVRIRKVLR